MSKKNRDLHYWLYLYHLTNKRKTADYDPHRNMLHRLSIWLASFIARMPIIVFPLCGVVTALYYNFIGISPHVRSVEGTVICFVLGTLVLPLLRLFMPLFVYLVVISLFILVVMLVSYT